MAELHELRFLLDGAGQPLTFPEELLPHEGARRLLEFLGVKIVKTNEQIDADLQARFGERELTARCLACPEWKFTGPQSEAVAAQLEHNASAEHGRNLLAAIDRGERVHLPKARGETMDDKCRVCKDEPAPPRGMYAGIGAACRAEGYVNKAGQIVKKELRQIAAVGSGQSGGLPLPGLPKPAPKPEPEPEIDVPVERKTSFEDRAERLVVTARKVDELQAAMGALNAELAEAMSEHQAAAADLLPA